MDVISKLYKFYKDFDGEKGYLGLTEKGKLIPYFKVSKTDFPVVIITYSIHAREYITTYLALKQIEDFVVSGRRGTVYFVPMVNIDGVEISLRENPLYKANGNGVDLNVNFDARWGKGKYNIRTPNSENYIGKYPFSESESRALRDFTLLVNPNVTLSYHSKGEEIYWYFFQDNKRIIRDYKIAKQLKKTTGYKIKTLFDSTGGYKDWCIDSLKIPSFTIEVGNDKLSHPILEDKLKKIYKQNKKVIKVIVESKWI
ncbi:MAG: hypothetical protein KBS91_02405 [Firmicutes bacterium]|nr:hypothetical protein [Candidatus Caballimonas caccae]